MAYLNYRELQTLGMNGVGENGFVQPMLPQTERVYHSKATAVAEKLEQHREEKGCCCGAWDRSWKMCLWGTRNTHVYKWVSASCFANCVYSDETWNCDVLPWDTKPRVTTVRRFFHGYINLLRMSSRHVTFGFPFSEAKVNNVWPPF